MTAADDIYKYFFIFFFRENKTLFHVNPLIGRGFTWNIKPYFLRKIKIKNEVFSAAIFVWRFKG